MTTCRVCNNTRNNRDLFLREMMFGTKETFAYFECDTCGTIQITKIPENLGLYYPSQYYSYRPPSQLKRIIKGPWLSDPFPATAMVKRIFTILGWKGLGPTWIVESSIRPNDRILDVGCGSGAKLLELQSIGHRNLVGLDPFLNGDTTAGGKIPLLRKELEQVDGPFDFIMFHHSFEHVPNPLTTLRQAKSKLSEGGRILIRVPIAGCWAWNQYRENWFQLDPPRHLNLLSKKAMAIAAEATGLKVEKTFFDSEASQFWASEQYAKGIALFSEQSYGRNARTPVFSRTQIREFWTKAENLNRQGLGDQGGFILGHKN